MHVKYLSVPMCALALVLGGCAVLDGPTPVREAAGVKNLIRDGRIYIAGTPAPEGLDALKAQGVRTVIDLRMPEEGTAQEEVEARARGLRYINIPMKSDQLTEAQAAKLMDAMKEAGGEPVLMHCGSANRAGAMYGYYLGASDQCPLDEAIKRARAAGMRNEKLEGDLETALRNDGSKGD